jgi:uncharacterized protein YprB with RNaseH-like and TPR domain
MASFQTKLGRLPAMRSPNGALVGPAQHRGDDRNGRPSLDELRERISRIIGRAPMRHAPANPSCGELPFMVEHTDAGPLYVRRLRAVPAACVGRVPLVGARDADASLLALLALDPALAACDPRRALYIDTETTGLAGGTGTVPFLVGLAWYDQGSGVFVLEQALLRRLGEEAPILALLARRVAEASMLVSFNGKAFDLPLLRTRFVMNRASAPVLPPHLDLVHVARRVHRTRLRSRTLAAIEEQVLGRARLDDVSGGDIVATYMHFLRTGDETALVGVVAHNEADVLAMVALVALYGERLTMSGDPTMVGDPTSLSAALDGADLAGVARTLRRAGALELAAELAEVALTRGGGIEARRAVGDIAKARGDKARALASFEALSAEVDEPGVRLQLCKLYEHHVRDYASALALVARGTGEPGEASERRRQRLARKLARTR